MSKDCKNVAPVYDETQEEEHEYDEEADWTDWTRAVTYDDWSYGDYCDYYQDSRWTEDSDWWDDGWYDNWTWETDVAPAVPPALSPPQPGPPSSTATSSAGFTEGRTASSAQNTAPNVSAVHSTVKVHTDMWRLDDQTEPPMSPPVVWTGVTVFQRSEPEVTVEQETRDKAAREAKTLPRPNEPTEQQRAQHNLMHLPYIGRHAYGIAELKKFVYEIGKTFGILQYDKEPALKALATATDTMKELGKDTEADESLVFGNGIQRTRRDFLTTPENDHGTHVDVKPKKKKPEKAFVGGRYGVALEEAVKAEMRGQNGAAGEVIDLLAQKTGSHPLGLEHILKAAERTEEKTKKQINKGKEHKLPVWEDSDSSSSD
eukprot:s686_g19.t1